MEYLELYGSRYYCCNAPSRIVRSREGGFVSQNCIRCGRPRKLPMTALPKLICPSCHRELENYINYNKNYAYRCISCGMSIELADLVPPWSEEFRYWGLAIDFDES